MTDNNDKRCTYNSTAPYYFAWLQEEKKANKIKIMNKIHKIKYSKLHNYTIVLCLTLFSVFNKFIKLVWISNMLLNSKFLIVYNVCRWRCP